MDTIMEKNENHVLQMKKIQKDITRTQKENTTYP